MAWAAMLLPCYCKLILNAECVMSYLSEIRVELGKSSDNSKQQNW